MEDLQRQKNTKKEVKKITEILNRKKKEMILNKQFKNSGNLVFNFLKKPPLK